MAIKTNLPTANSTTWLCDASADLDYVRLILPNAKDRTPVGQVKLSRSVTHYPQDITRKSRPGPFQGLLRGLLAMSHQSQRVGLITHSTLTASIKSLGEPFIGRIVKSTYFGSGKERASNDWYTECDLIIVAGTPRVNASAIRERLCKLGDFDSAGRQGGWGEVQWRGVTQSGQIRVVNGRGYRDEAWQKAYRSLVRSAIVQAVGRGRGVLEDGCDVIVVTNEACGFPLAERESIPSLTPKHCDVVQILSRLSAMDGSKNPESRAISTSEVASSIGLADRETRYILTDLERLQIIRRVGERGGWLPALADLSSN